MTDDLLERAAEADHQARCGIELAMGRHWPENCPNILPTTTMSAGPIRTRYCSECLLGVVPWDLLEEPERELVRQRVRHIGAVYAERIAALEAQVKELERADRGL